MRTLRIMGVLGVSAILLSASVAFAEETQVGVEQRVEARKEAKAKIEAQREEVKKRIETTREETKKRMEMKREEAKQRMNDIRDKTKKQMAEKIAGQLENLNKKWTDHFVQLLERYDTIVLKIQERTDIAAANGKDVTIVNTAIKSANAAIESARMAVIAQAAKTYVLDTSSITTTTVTTTTDSGQNELMKNLRNAFQDLHKTLFKDLKALRDGVMKDAKKAIKDALETLGKVPKVDDDNATSADKSNQ